MPFAHALRNAHFQLALAQAREEVEGVFQAGLDLFAVLEEAAHLQVLGDGHVGKDAPALGRFFYRLMLIVKY